MKIASVGDLMWYLERPTGEFPKRNRTAVVSGNAAMLGGSAINIAAHLARAGNDAKLISLVGAADRAKTLRALEKRGVKSTGLITHDGFSNFLVAFLDDKSARSVFIANSAPPHACRVLEQKLVRYPVIVYGGSRDITLRKAILTGVRKRAGIFVFAPSYSIFHHRAREIVAFAREADITIMNREEFAYFAHALGGRREAATTSGCSVVTIASEGARVYSAGRSEHVASQSGSRRDVIGAGDAFLAGFITNWLGPARHDPFAAASAASIAAARYVRKQDR